MKSMKILSIFFSYSLPRAADSLITWSMRQKPLALTAPSWKRCWPITKGDTLKYKAAVFLIENMPGHFSYAGNEIEEYYRIGEKILQSSLTPVQQRDSLLIISQEQFLRLEQNTISDIEVVTSESLIKNIETAFEFWETKPWAQHLSFKQFCEFLLPYKCVEFNSSTIGLMSCLPIIQILGFLKIIETFMPI